MVTRAFLALVLVAVVILVNHFEPLQPEVSAVYSGVGLALVGLVALVKPLKVLFVPGRVRAGGGHQRLDDFMPEDDREH